MLSYLNQFNFIYGKNNKNKFLKNNEKLLNQISEEYQPSNLEQPFSLRTFNVHVDLVASVYIKYYT